MQDISLHILDIVENSFNADSRTVEIRLEEDKKRDLLTLTIKDDGTGMDEAVLQKVKDPFFTSKQGKKVGLGIPLLAQAAREAGGEFMIQSRPGNGTQITASFILSHPDRKPLGEVDSTIQLLKISHPEIHFEYTYEER